MSIEDKMNEFVPGIAPGQVEFFHFAADGAVTRWWIIPGQLAPSAHGAAADHPLGRDPAPGWYSREGAPCGCDPREAKP